jgi:hypothetical protein
MFSFVDTAMGTPVVQARCTPNSVPPACGRCGPGGVGARLACQNAEGNLIEVAVSYQHNYKA